MQAWGVLDNSVCHRQHSHFVVLIFACTMGVPSVFCRNSAWVLLFLHAQLDIRCVVAVRASFLHLLPSANAIDVPGAYAQCACVLQLLRLPLKCVVLGPSVSLLCALCQYARAC